MKLTSAQKKAHDSAMKKKFKAAAFDIDGTLTDIRKFIMPGHLIKTLAHIPGHVPLAICTGRDIEHVQTRLQHICDAGPQTNEHRTRWFIFCENGGIGFFYDCRTQKYKKFFEIPWPNKKITQEAMQAFLKDRLGWHAVISIRTHSIIVHFPRPFYIFPRFINHVSKKTASRLTKIIDEMGLSKDFSVEDSGIGSVIIPRESGKGKAIKRWSEHLRIPIKDILVVGDQAQKGKNDAEFLSGDYGTSFTVGAQTPSVYPLPVLDSTGKKLWGPEGTQYLLEQIKFA